MTYQLHRLAAGNYDLILNGVVIGSVVRSSTSKSKPLVWRAELIDGGREGWPPPFTAAEHEFTSLGNVREWLNGIVVPRKWTKRI